MNREQMDARCGFLPSRYPLATALTPMQNSVEPIFDGGEALSRGTLFPGLDLPFMNVIAPDLPDTPQTELMAIDFVAHELGLYLDTHAGDKEAFELYQSFLAMRQEARRRYTELYGIIEKCGLLGAERYTWLSDPWPWDPDAGKER